MDPDSGPRRRARRGDDRAWARGAGGATVGEALRAMDDEDVGDRGDDPDTVDMEEELSLRALGADQLRRACEASLHPRWRSLGL